MLLNFRKRFFLDSGNDDVEALGACGIQHKQGESSVARDEADPVRLRLVQSQSPLGELCVQDLNRKGR
jgi:hypothetical protein